MQNTMKNIQNNLFYYWQESLHELTISNIITVHMVYEKSDS